MTTIENLQENSFTDLSRDEALELLRTIRLSRRTQKSSPKKKAASKKRKKEEKLSKEQAQKLLDLLGG